MAHLPGRIKPDISMYPVLRDQGKYYKWDDNFVRLTQAFGFGKALDDTYNPDEFTQPKEHAALAQAMAFLYAVLEIKVKTDEGRAIIHAHAENMDVRGIFRDLRRHAQNSMHATFLEGKLLSKISNATIVGWSGTYLSFINKYVDTVLEYNDHASEPLLTAQVKSMLEKAVASVPGLNQVKVDGEYHAVLNNRPSLDYSQYLIMLKNKAQVLDEERSGRRTTRGINLHEFDSSDTSICDEIMEYAVNLAGRPGNISAKMNKETWSSLSPEGQKTWDQLSDKDKARILTYARNRGSPSKAPSEQRSVNFTDLSPDPDTVDTTPDPEPSIDEGQPDASHDVDSSSEEIAINQAISQARRDAHPGDPRKMLSSPNPTPTGTRTANIAMRYVEPEESPLSGGMSSDPSDDEDESPLLMFGSEMWASTESDGDSDF